MALNAFRANPSIGGFGNENSFGGTNEDDSNADAFAQIVKELTDNAVDACSCDVDSNSSYANEKVVPKRRVRVLFENVEEEVSALKVTVSDNGCGMKDIKKCVAAFSSSKQSSGERLQGTNSLETEQTVESLNNLNPNSSATRAVCCPEEQKSLPVDTNNDVEAQTTGRYGIGLTLCLLHTQNIASNSYATISSTTSCCDSWKKVKYVVNENEIDCIEQTSMTKIPGTSGTSVSVLLAVGYLLFALLMS